MNITVIRLVIVATSTGFVVMCKILTVVAFFCMRALFYFPWPRLTTARLDKCSMCAIAMLGYVQHTDTYILRAAY